MPRTKARSSNNKAQAKRKGREKTKSDPVQEPLCFAAMPFDPNFDYISEIIRKSAKAANMRYVRGDLRHQPGSVMAQIIRDIRSAAVVVADVTGHNPNVFYELGIAHQEKGPGRVVIITQSTAKSPFDVSEFRQLAYTNTPEGLRDLQTALPEALRQAMHAEPDSEHWSVIRGKLQRTKVIVRDLRRLLGEVEENGRIRKIKADPVQGLTIRVVAGLSSLAISDEEPPDNKEGPEYDRLLREERDTLRRALLKGARLKVLLNPPRILARQMVPERLMARYRRLIDLLQGRSDLKGKAAKNDLKAMQNCQWALNPVPMPNQMILGEEVAYEGFKRSGRRGFDRTHCETSPKAIKELVEAFDSHFDDCVELGKNQNLAQTLQDFYDEAIARHQQC